MVRVSGCCDEDSEDEDQNSSDWNARNKGDDSQEIIPNIEEEGRREGNDDGVERVESMEHVMEDDNALGSVSMPLVSQVCEAPRTEVNAVITEVYVQSVEDQLVEIDVEIAKFDAPTGTNGRIESKTSNIPCSRPQNVVGWQENLVDPRMPRMDELDEPIATIRGRVRNVQRKPKQVEHACNVENEGLQKGVGSTVLIKRNKRDFDEGLEVLEGSKKRKGGAEKNLAVEAGSQPRRNQ